jgi:hypothetical protein
MVEFQGLNAQIFQTNLTFWGKLAIMLVLEHDGNSFRKKKKVWRKVLKLNHIFYYKERKYSELLTFQIKFAEVSASTWLQKDIYFLLFNPYTWLWFHVPLKLLDVSQNVSIFVVQPQIPSPSSSLCLPHKYWIISIAVPNPCALL